MRPKNHAVEPTLNQPTAVEPKNQLSNHAVDSFSLYKSENLSMKEANEKGFPDWMSAEMLVYELTRKELTSLRSYCLRTSDGGSLNGRTSQLSGEE